MNKLHSLISLALLSASILGLGLAPSATAKTLVTCGPGGAARIVEQVPPGCRVLVVNSPPGQAGNQ